MFIWSNESCIIVFATELPCSKLAIKSFVSPNKDWRHLTATSRQCEENRNELDAYDVVCGPMVANVNGIIHEKQTAKAHKPSKHQCAFKSDRADLYLMKHMIGVVWLDKHIHHQCYAYTS